jgi:hypothetical protein
MKIFICYFLGGEKYLFLKVVVVPAPVMDRSQIAEHFSPLAVNFSPIKERTLIECDYTKYAFKGIVSCVWGGLLRRKFPFAEGVPFLGKIVHISYFP